MTKGAPVPPHRVATRGFHGTSFDFTGEVLPKSMHGNVKFEMSGKNDTYFLPGTNPENERGSWQWSRSTAYPGSGLQTARHRVHVTEPDPEQHIDANLHGVTAPRTDEAYDTYARVAPRQRILDTHWAPPPGEWDTHVESTLPHVNWRQFGAPNYLVHETSGRVSDERNFEVQAPTVYRSRSAEFNTRMDRRVNRGQVEDQRRLPGIM